MPIVVSDDILCKDPTSERIPVISVEPQLAARHLDIPNGEVKLSEAACILFRLVLALDYYLLVQVEKNEVTLIDIRRKRLLVRFSGSPRSLQYKRFKSLGRQAATYTEYRIGKVQTQDFQRAWKTMLNGRVSSRYTPSAMVAVMMDWLTGETIPTSPVATEAQIKERMGMYAAKLDS